MWLIDPKNKKKSVTLTLFVIGFTVCLFKLIGSGISVYGVRLEQFSGTDFAAAIGALGGIYAWRRGQNK